MRATFNDARFAGPSAQLTFEEYPLPRRLFAVISWGAAATHWLARALNDCPGIYCAHTSNTFWSQFADAEPLDGVRYLTLVGVLGSGCSAAGDVHGVSTYDVAPIKQAFGERFRAVALVRDPLSRLRSQLGLFSRFAGAGPWSVDYLRTKFPRVTPLLPTGGYEEWLFVHAANMFNKIQEEQLVGPIARMEDLTSDPYSLTSLVTYLTSGEVRPNIDWAIASINYGATNAHSTVERLRLTDWQRNVFSVVVEEQSLALYRTLGYEPDRILTDT